MEGKTGLIMGVANERSIAWGIANQLFLNKANIILTYQNDSLKKRIEPLSEKIECKKLYKCDVSLDPEDEYSIENLIKRSNTLEEDKLINKEYFNFIVERTSQGIFQLTCFINQNKKIFGYARTNMKTQKIILQLLNSDKYKDNDLLMKCKYNKKFSNLRKK